MTSSSTGGSHQAVHDDVVPDIEESFGDTQKMVHLSDLSLLSADDHSGQFDRIRILALGNLACAMVIARWISFNAAASTMPAMGIPPWRPWSAAPCTPHGDSRPENENSLIGNAGKSFQPQQIVITHANLPTITHCYAQLLDIIHSRNLQTVTLNDVFG